MGPTQAAGLADGNDFYIVIFEFYFLMIRLNKGGKKLKNGLNTRSITEKRNPNLDALYPRSKIRPLFTWEG